MFGAVPIICLLVIGTLTSSGIAITLYVICATCTWCLSNLFKDTDNQGIALKVLTNLRHLESYSLTRALSSSGNTNFDPLTSGLK